MLVSRTFLRVWVYRFALAKVDFDALALYLRALSPMVLALPEGVVSMALSAYRLSLWFETVSLVLSAYGLVS